MGSRVVGLFVSMKSPAFQFYPTDYLGSQRVQMMTLEEEGAYIRLLSYCWQHGDIPSDPDKVARLIGKGASTTLATTVISMFQPSENHERMIHDRLEAERAKQAVWKAKSSEGGKKSAELRKQKSTTLEPPLEGCLKNGGKQKATLHIPSSSSSSSSIPLSLPDTKEEEREDEAVHVGFWPELTKEESPKKDIIAPIFEKWATMEGVPRITTITESRKKLAHARMKEPFFRENWIAGMEAIRYSPFLTGKNDRGWKADIDWFLRPDSLPKILEGKYETQKTGFNGIIENLKLRVL